MKARRFLEAGLFVAGVALLAGVIREADGHKVWEALRPVRGWAWFFLAVYPVISFIDVLGWVILIPARTRFAGTVWHLFWIRLAGEAWNQITPFVDVGGEAAKVGLTARALGMNRRFAIVSVVLERTALFLSEVIFWCVGLVPVFFFFELGRAFEVVCAVTLLTGIVGTVIMIRSQKGGFLAGWAAGLRRRFWPKAPEAEAGYWTQAARDVEEEIRSFYQRGGWKWPASIALHTFGWMAGGVETFCMLKAIGADISLTEALFFEAILQLARTASFFIPQNLGAQEGALALVARAIGLDPSIGVALSLLKRVRQWVWVAAGLFVWAWLERALPARATEIAGAGKVAPG